jgi:tetratricopeptide (TPR) repeat protein
MRKRTIIAPVLTCILTLVFLASTAFAAESPITYFESDGFNHFYNNEYDQALDIFARQVQEAPDDAVAYNAVAQTILYREMYRNGALESELVTGSNLFLHRSKMEISQQDRGSFNNAINRAISLSQAKLDRNPRDVHALYTLAVAHGLRANFLFSIDKSWMQALRESITGRKANDKILDLDPSFVDAHLIHGLSEYIVSCLPAYLRFLGKLNGFHGDKEGGIKQLQMVSTGGIRNQYDASILLAVIYRREHRPSEAIPLLNDLASRFPRNYLFRFEQVQMYSDLGDKTSALAVIAGIEDARRRGKPGYNSLALERVRYARGNLLFWYNDLDGSLDDLKLATQHPGGLDLSTATMAWLRMGQVYDLLRDRSNAIDAYRMAISTAPNSEIAKEASDYVDKPYKRNGKA